MDQRVFLKLENGEIVSLDDGDVSGTSYVVQDDAIASTSYVVQGEGLADSDYIVQEGSSPRTSYVLQNGVIAKTSCHEHDNNTPTSGSGEATTVNGVVEDDGAQNVVYIVQQEGSDSENMQYAVIGEAGSIGSAYAIQAVKYSNEKLTENKELTQVQDMSGIETLSRVATQEFAGSIMHMNAEKEKTELGKRINTDKQAKNVKDERGSESVKICFSCQHCGDEYEDLPEFKLHLKNVHGLDDMDEESEGGNEYTLYPSCQVCSQTFDDVQDLEAHKKVHSEEFVSLMGISTKKSELDDKASKKTVESFKCRSCQDTFYDKSSLIKHVSSKHSKGVSEERSSNSFTKCPYCHKMYVQRGSNKSMIKHIYTAHPGKSVDAVIGPGNKDDKLEEKVNCFSCGLGFYWHKSLIRHIKDRHPKLLEEKGDQIFAELGIKDLQMPSVKLRRSTKDDSHSGELLSCPNCPKKFLWVKSLRRHMFFYHKLGSKTVKRGKKVPVVYCCPHCSLVSKYACAVRKHMERKHSQLIKGIDVTTFQLPTMEAEAATDIELKTVDKRPAEVRLNFCPVIFRCPFCTYATKQGSNLIRHLTSVKHGHIFTHEELKKIGISSFRVNQELMKGDDTEKLDGTSSNKLGKLKLKGRLLDIVMRKFEIIKNRKQENKENGRVAAEDEEEFSEMDIDNIIDMAEDESEESFNEDDDNDDFELEREDEEETVSRNSFRERKDTNRKVKEKRVSGKFTLDKTANDKPDKVVETCKDQAMNDSTEIKFRKGSKGMSSRKKSDSGTLDIELLDNDPDENAVVDIRTSIRGSGIKPKDSNKDKNEKVPSSEQAQMKIDSSPRKLDGTELKFREANHISEKLMSVDKKRISQTTEVISVNLNTQESQKVDKERTDSQECQVCQKTFGDFTAFKQHLSSHVNIRVFFRCVECGCEIPFLKDLKSHLLKEHGQKYPESSIASFHTNVVKMDSKPVNAYDCPYCEMLFSQSNTLQQHVVMDHVDNIQSARVKQESTDSFRGPETIVSAFNCKFCECFYYNIKDMVKHMYVVHRDIDKSDSSGNSISVRKSGRKRKLPKWLEETSDNISKTKRLKHLNNVDVSPVLKRKEKNMEVTQESGRVQKDRNKDSDTSNSEKLESRGRSEKDNREVKSRVISETNKKNTSLNLIDSENEITFSKKAVKRPVSARKVAVSFDLHDGTENKNKCPHCDFTAKRSSALSFHINFKHANEKGTDIEDDEKQETGKQSLVSSPKKLKTKGSVELSTFSSSKKGKSNTVVTPTETSAFAEIEDQLYINDDKFIEINEKKHSRSLFDIKSKSTIIQETSKTSKGLEDNEMETENEFSDFEIEFGDSDDDYRPERDDYEDSSSDIEESDDETSMGKGNISINLKCPYCQIGNFSNFSLLESHVKEQHAKQAKSFSIADVKTEVEIDGTVSGSDLVYSCKYCDKRFLSKSHVRTHMKNRHRKKLHAKRKRDAEGYKKSDEELYKCKFCDVVASSVERIIFHINRQHPEQDISNDEIQKYMYLQTTGEEILQDLFKCPYCETKSRWKQAVLRHMGHSHPGVEENEYDEIICEREIVRNCQQKKYQCVYCNWQYDRKEDVLTHLFDTHPDQSSVTEDDIFEVEISVNVEDHFQCPYCSLQSKYKRCIIRHVSRAHKDKKGFTKSDVICLSTKKSRNSVTEGLVFMCPFCDFDSRWKQCIIRHVENSHPEMKDFDPETILSEHRKKSLLNLDNTHPMNDKDDVEYFKCSFCDAVSETKDGVLAHTYRSHPKKSDFMLSQVEKALWNGTVTSDEDVIYKCPVCECGSKWKKRVVLHVKTEHPEVEKFHVELCKADFMRDESELGAVYMCKLCNELLTSTRGVTAHALQVHGKEEQIVVETISADQKLINLFKCMYCEHRSALRSAIMKHVEIHHPVVDDFQPKDVICEIVREGDLDGKGGFQCPYCDTVNHWKKSIVRHMKTVHPCERQDIEIHFNPAVTVKGGGRSSRKSSKQINCLRCGTSCRSIEKMRKHFLSKHLKLVKNFLNKENTEFSYESFAGRPLDYVCVMCNARYMWKKSLLVHVKNQHRDMYQVYQTLDNVVDIVASAAGPDTSASQQSVVERPNVIKETVDSEPRRCGKCKLIFKTRWAASVHKRFKHEKHTKRRIQCSKCSLSFSRQSLYLQHKIRYHRNQRHATTLNCSVPGCNFRCRFSKILHNHYKNLHNLNIPWPNSTAFIEYSLSKSESCRCEICMKTFSSAYQLKQHVALHKKQRRIRFQCGTCGEQFLTRTLRDSHIETFHLDKAEMCDICGALFAKSNMKKHMKAHDEENSEETECPYCQKVVTARMFNRHMLYEHQDILNCQCAVCLSGEEVSDQVRHTCLVCKKSFCQQTMLFVHSKLQHVDKNKSKFFYCEACPDLYFLTKRMKDIHCHEHHRKRPATVPKQSTTVSRSTSTYSSNDPTTHVIHIGQDEGKQYLPKLSESSMNAVIKELLVFERGVENPYKCLLCGRSFSKSKYIKLHIRRAHVRDEDQPYRCKVCGSGFVRLTEFRKHSRSHSDFRPYKCRYCDKAFKQQANLRDHYRVHTNTKEYECFICKTEFRQRGGLTSHVVFHDTLKPFQCMYCQKGFTTRGELSRHMQKYSKDITQTAEKNYPCHICEESFPHYPMLLKHIDAHNPEKPFQCAACKEKFSNYVAMYFHKVKNEHFLLEEIQEGMKDLQKRGRKFRAKKSSSKLPGPEIVYATNQPMTETIYISQPNGNAENEAGIKPVEVIIEEFGQDQIVRVQENEPEHEELLSIAKQLTELSGFHGSEYFTNKKNVHQEEDEIIKDMLDADEDVLANLSKQGAGNKSYDDERDNTNNFERTEQRDMNKDIVEENYEYMPEIENDIQVINESAASSEVYSYVSETGGQVKISASSVPTNMEELVTLVSQNSSANNSDQVMAYQSEDGSVIYVCLPEDQNGKTEEIATEEISAESDMIEDMPEAAVQETDESDLNIECTETVEELDEEHSNSIIDATQIAESTVSVDEEQAIKTSSVDIIHIPASQEIEPLNEIQQSEETDVQAEQTENAVEEILDKGEQDVTQTKIQPFETSEVQMGQFITSEQVIPVTSEQTTITATHLEKSVVEEIQNQDYTIVEPKFENSIITIQPQDTLTEVMPESQEDLIQRSQLARHLTGNIQPREETPRLQTHLIVTEQGLQNINRFEPLVSQEVTQGQNISQGLITIAATASNSTHVLDDSVTSSSNFEQVAVTRQEDSFVEGEETLVEYQIDESRFIKEELLDADYSAMSEKDREVMFFSDNIYTYSQLEKKFICLHCGVKIGSFKNLKNHIRRHAPKSARTHVCTYCSKRFVTKNELKRHSYTHTGERNYECKDCGKKFIQPGHLQEHQRLHTGQKPFQCSDCPAAFITKSQLVLHYSRLHSNNEIPCTKCDKVFKSHIDLRRHKGLEHSGTKESTQVVKVEVGEHVCDICGQSFNKKATLKRHLEKHNLESLDESEKVQERFACEVCGISFKSKYYVKDHFKMVHSQEKNEICELCGMGFKTKTMLKRHKFCKHPEEEGNRKWHCDICNKSLGSKCAYGYHMGSKHPNVCSDK